MIDNPFVTNGYVGPEYFCDRAKETEMLTTWLTNGNNVALMSPRRIGKTDLLRHCFSQDAIIEKYHCIIIDIYPTSSMREFVNVFGKAILDEVRTKGRKIWESFLQILSSIRSEISFDINGQPVWGLGLSEIKNPSITLDEIFQYLNSADRPCLIAIDEFQQITKYKSSPNIEASLRTYIQRCPNASFVFSGSHRHLMNEMFVSPSRPFYQSVILMNLPPISVDAYRPFASNLFEQYGKHLDVMVVDDLFDRFDSITAYIQRAMNMLFILTPKGGICNVDMIEPALTDILNYSSDTYEALLYQMPEKQRAVFLAIASEGKAKNILGGKFIHKYNLPTPSSVRSAVNILLDKDFITMERGEYMVYDRFFELWLKRNGLIK